MLTTSADIASYLGLKNPSQLVLDSLEPYALAASAFVERYTGRTFGVKTIEEQKDAPAIAHPVLVVTNPIVKILSLYVNKVQWNEVLWDSGQKGYEWQNGRHVGFIYPVNQGWPVSERKKAIRLKYITGFLQEFNDVVAATVKVPLVWAMDISVTINNLAAIKVTSAPAIGQYAVQNGVYTFNASDAGKSLSIIYAGVPADIQGVVSEIAAFKYTQKDRVGIVSKSLGAQESITYADPAINEGMKSILGLYKAKI